MRSIIPPHGIPLTQVITFSVLRSSLEKLERFKTDGEERKWKGDFTFILGADPQFGLIDRCILKRETPGWDMEIKLSEAAIHQINAIRPKPKFFVVCGDMLDAFPNEDDMQTRELQLLDFYKVFSKIGPEISLIYVCGNHDIGQIPTQESLQIYKKQFGPDYFIFWAGGVRFVVLNSQYFMNCDHVKEDAEKQNELIGSLVEETDAAVHTIVFQHIPFFRYDPEEQQESNSNLELGLRMKLLEKLRNAGVRHIFSGHYHRNAGGVFKDIEQVVTGPLGGPLGNDPSGYRVVQVAKNEIKSKYVTI